MSNTLQIKRGLQVNLPTGLAGELLFTTDTKRLYISDGAATNLIQGASTLLTTGAVPFSDANGKITMDATKLYWDNTNKRLGIGTATPGYALDVNSTSRITQSNAGNTPNLILATPASNLNLKFFVDQIAAYDNATSSALYLNYNGGDIGLGGTKATLKYGTGNFLIGTTTDAGFRLDVNGTARVNNNFTAGTLTSGVSGIANITAGDINIQSYGTNNAWLADNAIYNAGFKRVNAGYASLFYFNGEEGQFRFGSTDVAGSAITNGTSGYGVVALKTNIDGSFAVGDMTNAARTYTGAKFFVNGLTGNVGVGTITPSYKLDVNGTGRFQGTDLVLTGSNSGGNPVRISTTNTDSTGVADAFFFNSAGNYFGAQMYGTTATGTFANVTNANLAKFVTNASNFVIGTQGASPIVFAVNALAASGEVGRFSSTGNLLIGTTTDGSYKLDVNGAARISSTLVTGGGTPLSLTGESFAFQTVVSSGPGGSVFGTNASSPSFIDILSGSNFWHISNRSSIGSNRLGIYNASFVGSTATYSSELLTLTTSGNLGIGTTSPGALLHVNGNLIAGASTTSGMFFNTANDTLSITNQRVLEKSGSNILIGYTCDSLQFRTVSTERMRIDSSGNVGIGTTAPGRKLTVNGIIASQLSDANDIQGLLYANTTAVEIHSTYGSTGSYVPMIFKTNNAERLRIDTAGNVGIGTTSPTGLLDINTGSVNITTYASGQDLKLSTAGFFARANRIYNTVTTSSTTFFGAYGASYSGVTRAYWTIGDQTTDSTGWTFSSGIHLISNGNVLINTTTDAGAKLFVRGSGTTGSTFPLLLQNSAGNDLFKVQDDGIAYLGKASAYFRILQNGNDSYIQKSNYATGRMIFTGDSVSTITGGVLFDTTKFGINTGTTTATATLQVKGTGTTSATTSLLIQNSAGTQALKVLDDTTSIFGDSTTTVNNLSTFYGSIDVKGSSATGAIINMSSASNSAITYAGGSALYIKSGLPNLIFQTNGANERMRIDTNGNVGIGTTTTTNAKLEVFVGAGTTSGLRIKAYSDASTAYLLSAGTESYQDNFKIKMINGDVTMGTQLNGYTFGLYTFNGTALTVANSGNILIGTTTDAGYKLRVSGGNSKFDNSVLVNATAPDLIPTYAPGTLVVKALDGSDAFHLMGSGANNILNISNPVNGSITAIAFLNNTSTPVGTITLTTSGTSYNTLSDYRLKTDFKDFNGTDILSKINVYDFAWESDGERSYGVKAHELQSVIPHIVSGEKDAIKEDGTISPQQVDYSKLVPVLIKAIQELKAELDTIKNK